MTGDGPPPPGSSASWFPILTNEIANAGRVSGTSLQVIECKGEGVGAPLKSEGRDGVGWGPDSKIHRAPILPLFSDSGQPSILERADAPAAPPMAAEMEAIAVREHVNCPANHRAEGKRDNHVTALN